MKKLTFPTIFISLLIYSSSLWSKAHKLQYRPGFYTAVMEDNQTSARVFGTQIDLNYYYIFNGSLRSTIKGGAVLETGSNNSLNLKEFSPDRELILSEASLEWRPFESKTLQVKLGSLPLEGHQSPLLFGSSVFMGLQERITFGEDYKISIEGLQSIPNNQTLASRAGGIEDGTPTFFMEKASLNLDGDLLSIKASFAHFKYMHLSGAVANQSRFMGNDVGGTSATSYFLYGFEGHNSTLEVKTNKNGYFRLSGSGEFLFNSKAPNGQNKGVLIHGDLSFGDFSLGLSHFRNERNSSPAYYNSKYYGHNNKKGVALEFSVRNVFEQFNFKARVAQFDLIDTSNALLSSGQLFTLSLVKSFSTAINSKL